MLLLKARRRCLLYQSSNIILVDAMVSPPLVFYWFRKMHRFFLVLVLRLLFFNYVGSGVDKPLFYTASLFSCAAFKTWLVSEEEELMGWWV